MTRARDVANIDGLLTTTGDTYYASAAGTPARLGIGSTSQVLTVSGGVPSWATPAGGSTFAGAKVTNSTNPTIATATVTALAFNQETYDTNTYHDTATNNSRITIPSGKAGYYMVTFNAQWDANAVGRREAILYLNGTGIMESEVTASASAYPTPMISYPILLTVGDYLQIQVYQSSGGNLILYSPTFSVSYLGA